MSASTARQRLGLIAGSVELCSLAIASYIPSRLLRIVALRCWGARVSLRAALHHGLQVRAARRLEVGPDTFIAEGVVLDARGGLRIGPHTSINTGVQIWTAQHDWRSADFAYVSAPVRIGHHCWVSARAVVLPGVTIGDGAVVAAGAVVTKDVAPWTLVGGNPARLLRERPRDLDYELDAVRQKPWWW
jgi:acetyltransferase-like isoleucine patch superfamily enzyme